MRAALYPAFRAPLAVETVPDPTPSPHGAVLAVRATGLCLSDWHGWMGHDAGIRRFPHVPGHELAGVVAAVGAEVRHWTEGDRVTVPFVCACGACTQCAEGHHQVCDRQTQPGFTHWGSYAEFVAVEHADVNLVRLPEALDFVTAASLGCRFATAFRAVVDQGRVRPGQWVAVHGCGGVGLSALLIARAVGARVVAVDLTDEKRAFARALGAAATVDAGTEADVADAIRTLTDGGAHVSIDAVGGATTAFHSVGCLRARGRHVQVGLLVGDDRRAPLPMDRVLAHELEVVGSHGLAAHRYPALLAMIADGAVDPRRLIARTVSLDEAARLLPTLHQTATPGVTVIDRFGAA